VWGIDEKYMATPDPKFQKAAREFRTLSEAAVKKITAQNIYEYQTNGVTVVRSIVDDPWIELLREACETSQDNPGEYAEYLQKPTDEGIFFTDLEIARRDPVIAAFIAYSPVAAVTGTILQTKSIRYLYDQLFVKEAGVSTRTPWHLDGG
jgi:hypothetical protein